MALKNSYVHNEESNLIQSMAGLLGSHLSAGPANSLELRRVIPLFQTGLPGFSPTTAQQAAGANFNAKYHGNDGPVKTGFPFRLLNGSFYELAQQAWKIFWPLLAFSRDSVYLKSIEASNPAVDNKYFVIHLDLTIQTELERLSQDLWYTNPISNGVIGNVVPGDKALPRNIK
ncbi:hypothetical protein F4814DRAFT_449253 [Daldinia grandis]|nr:hypothetical protein F4814DRAFT_449253 [Daldinia grandis]